MDTTKLKITKEAGDLFNVSNGTLLVHSCNCKGSWDAGIANEFMKRYPEAYVQYNQLCRKEGNALLGKSMLIVCNIARKYDINKSRENGQMHFIGCLFTSDNYGKNKDSPSKIVQSTKDAVQDLLCRIDTWNRNAEEENKITSIKMCKINSGMFNVPWNSTEKVIESIDATVYSTKYITVIAS